MKKFIVGWLLLFLEILVVVTIYIVLSLIGVHFDWITMDSLKGKLDPVIDGALIYSVLNVTTAQFNKTK